MTPSDVDAYLARLGTTSRVLADIHLAHLKSVPFENLSIHRGEPIVLDPALLYAKIVGGHRGGFCYELNGLFAELLVALGHRVERLAARVYGKDGALGIPFDHMCLRVDDVWLADVGFGDSFITPLRLDNRQVQSDGRRTFRIADDGDGFIVEDDGKPAFRAERTPYALADFEPGCAYHTTSPDSHFTRGSVVSRLTDDGRVTLRTGRLIETRQGETKTGDKRETPVADQAEWNRLLAMHFGIRN